jgi:hypothetical protein
VVTLNGTVGGSATSGSWSTNGTGAFGNANQLNTTYTPSAADVAAGTITLTLTTNDPAGPCSAASDQMVITINPAATVNAGPDQTVCASSPMVMLAGAVGGGASNGMWGGGAGNFNPNANTLNATYTPSAAEIAAGMVTLTLTTNDPAGPCGARNDQMVITIKPITLSSFMRDGDCNGLPTGFDVVFNNSNSSCNPAVSNPFKLAATNPGVFTYNLRVTNNGTTPTGQFTVTINLGDNPTTPGVVDGAAIQTTPFSPTLTSGSSPGVGQPAFVLKGHTPVRVYDADPCPVLSGTDITACSAVSITRQDNTTHQLASGAGASCPALNQLPANETLAKQVTVTVNDIPAGGVVFIRLSLDYRLKDTHCWTSNPDSRTGFNQGYQFRASDISIGGSAVPDFFTYFTATGKKVTAVGGYALKSNGAPAPNLTATVAGGSSNTSNVIGYYFIPVAPSATGYNVSLATAGSGAPVQPTGPIAQDQYVEVNFLNLNPADPAVDVGVVDEQGVGVRNVTVELIHRPSDRLLGTKPTNSGGYCGFRFSQPGQYTVRITPPAGYVADEPARSISLAQFQELAVRFRVRRR